VPGKITDVIAAPWELAGDASGAHVPGDRVILEDGVLATVEDADGDRGGSIQVVADGNC